MVVEVVGREVQGRAGWSQPANQPPESRLPESRGREGGHHRPHLTVNPGSSTCNSCSPALRRRPASQKWTLTAPLEIRMEEYIKSCKSQGRIVF